MARIYYDKDADLSVLRGKTVAVIGYGIQGRGQALICATAASRSSSRRLASDVRAWIASCPC